MVNTWFFKRASDAEKGQAMYYFRLVEPDFTPLPVYDALKQYMHSAEAQVLYPGIYQEDHWALIYEGPWETLSDPAAELGSYTYTQDPESRITLTFSGTDLWLRAGPGEDAAFSYTLDGGRESTAELAAGEQVQLAQALAQGQHTLTLRAAPGPLTIDSLTIHGRDQGPSWLVAGGVILTAGLIGALAAALIARRRRWYQRSRA